ncbi:hypothetical protein RP20_CCG002893 [Aedes albopictus]|nr:hypothetical protein RP20_CCG002893 [Aedes albopictus]
MSNGILAILLAITNNSPVGDDIENAFRSFNVNYLYGNASAYIRDTVEFDQQYDFIVVGAGTGGCVMANRLSENPNWSVLLLEAGKEENLLLSVPMTAPLNVKTDYNWNYHPQPMATACMSLPNGTCPWPRGRGLGGSSLLNFMVYTRGHRLDYDDWAAAGNYGWSYEEVLPYFLKGEGSYIKISENPFETPLLDKFKRAMDNFGYNEIDPYAQKQLGYYKIRSTTYEGQRYSAARDYLHPVRDRPNLHISMESRVTKILIDAPTKTAYGVEFMKHGILHKVKTRKEVILCAGAIASPQLLMLSGIGPQRHLETHGIPVIQSLNVGYNLHDHCTYTDLNFLLNQTVTMVPDKTTAELFQEYITNHTGPFSVPARFESIAFVKTPHSILPAEYPDIEIMLVSTYLNGENTDAGFELLGIPQLINGSIFVNFPGHDRFSLFPVIMRPRSRGRISLKSSNPFVPPLMEPNYLSNQHDIITLIDGMKMVIRIAESQNFAEYGARLDPTPVPACAHLRFRSNRYWRCVVRQLGKNIHHQSGTCKMGPASDPTAVVNPELQVHGVRNLRVVDTSVIPLPIAGHPNGVVFMIGEKAADMVKQHWARSGRR